MNRAGLAMIEAATFDQVKGKNVYPLVSEECREAFITLSEDVFRGRSGKLEFKMVGLKGRPLWLYTHAVPLRNEKGEIISLLATTIDITERKTMEEALRIGEARLKHAQHIAHVGDWEWEVASGRVHWSDELYRIYGYAPREIAPDYGLVVEAMHPKSRDVFLSAIDAALKGERPFELDYSFFRRDGSEAFLHTIGQVIRGNDGAPVRMVGIVQDITEQKQAEEALRESEEKFRSIFDTANDGILIADISTRKFIEANNTMCAMLGYDRKEIANLGIADIHPLRDLSHILEQFGKQMRGEKTIVGDLPVKRKDGSVFYADVCASLIVLGGEQYAVGIFRDITERKHAEEKMKNALREKEILLKEIHHRVKNNLQIVASMLRLQSVKIRDGDARILFEASRNRVLTMSLIHEQLYRTENLAYIDFRAYVEELVANVFALVPENASQIKKQIDVEEVALAVDHAIPCGLIINELVSNALRHAFPGEKAGTIVIGMRRDNGGGIVLLVADNGTGLPEGTDPMQTKTLGLQLVHSLAKQLNGAIEVDKIGGTSVRITFQT
jgi:PAS domain S-box-containing protein